MSESNRVRQLDCITAGPQPAAGVTAVRRSPRQARQANTGSASALTMASQAKAASSGGLQSPDETAKGAPCNTSKGEAEADATGASVAAAPMASAAEQHPSVSKWNVMEVGFCCKG